ncbi:hypothetical protein [Paenilisteria rocourtiae]|uniref:Uncharacterized protein n=1 Tax=Listeria rocourtiae TaxID=647910 RepID=A0A4R6ZNE9_9LIST|nr:hypothetical protein [Listeria rocourtiae]EUJ42558.1 hypothetical protein PROCOU_16934 [Listeria rocourtiae FSL F6-920]TDR53928.1 hypothetical protein DFP96_10322 [Listeria rocourtiae]
MTKLNVTKEAVEDFKRTGALAEGTSDGYILLEVRQSYQNRGALKEYYIVEHTPSHALFELTVTTTFKGRMDLVGNFHSATVKPLTAHQQAKVKHAKTARPVPTPTTEQWREELKSLKGVL